MRKIKYKAQCQNVNELFVLFQQAKNLEIKIAGEDEVQMNANVLADMEKITAIYNVLRLETKAMLKKIGVSEDAIKSVRGENHKHSTKDIKDILEKVRKG